MLLGVVRELTPNERRVALTPAVARQFVECGYEVRVQAGAGESSSFTDEAYRAAGAEIVEDAHGVWTTADVVVKVEPPRAHPTEGWHEADLIKEGATLVSFVWPGQAETLVARLAKRQVTLFAMDQVPRTSRAQKMDALSAMANIAGYRAVVEASHHFGRFFTQQITAAGKLPPARVLVIGAGVAGLSAIATARGLGAVVRAFDTRPVVREQVQSLGADFLMLDFEEDGAGTGGYAKVMSEAFINAEMALFREQASKIDIVITTALIPGRKAPLLWPAEMVALMKPGSVVVDLAAAQGGNCELTTPGEVVTHDGVTVIGYTDMTSRLPTTASELYATTVMHLLGELGDGAGHHVDHGNLEVRGALVLEQGELRWPAPPPPAAPVVHKETSEKGSPEQTESLEEGGASAEVPLASEATLPATPSRPWVSICVGAALLGLWLWLKLGFRGEVDSYGPGSQAFLQHLTVFVLAVFVGWQVIWNVTAALHTPLMSVTNAISGIIIIGGMVQSSADLDVATTLGLVAVFFAMINVAGGFLVTQRMLSMFRR